MSTSSHPLCHEQKFKRPIIKKLPTHSTISTMLNQLSFSSSSHHVGRRALESSCSNSLSSLSWWWFREDNEVQCWISRVLTKIDPISAQRFLRSWTGITQAAPIINVASPPEQTQDWFIQGLITQKCQHVISCKIQSHKFCSNFQLERSSDTDLPWWLWG